MLLGGRDLRSTGLGLLGLTACATACTEPLVLIPEGTGSTGSDGSTSTGEPSLDTTATTGDTTASDDGTSSGTTDGGPSCTTSFCGDPGQCCAAGQVCVRGACVAACPFEARCGVDLEVCCRDGELCIDGTCVAPAGPCRDGFDCSDGELCEPGLDQCLPRPGPPTCVLVPDAADIEVQLEWSFETEQIISMPAVGDIDGDERPEVVVNTFYADGVTEFYAEIIVLDGTAGFEQFRIQHDLANDEYGSYARSTVGLADVDDDELADIVYVGRPQVSIFPFANNSSLVHAVNGIGQHLWSSHAPDGSPHFIYIRHGAPAFANFDADDASEIVFGTAVIDNDGTVVFDQDRGDGLGGGVYGSNGNYLGGISAIADLTGDGYPEIVSGREAWSVSWNDGMSPPEVSLTPLWAHPGPDGFPAIADLDLDGDPEVVVVGDPAPFAALDGVVYVLDGATGALWCGVDPTGDLCAGNDALRTQPIPLPGGGRGGPPVIADFDGDGRPEIAVAGQSSYTVFDLARMGETIVQPPGDPPPQAGDIYVRWSAPVQDPSSAATGSSAFDFHHDGAAEALFGDQCHLRIFDGATGAVAFEQQSSSATIHEYPVVADIDDDGHSELVVVANDANASTDCGAIPGYAPRRGVYVYRDPSDRWPRTRRAWNAHTHHMTSTTSTGTVPPLELPHWAEPGLNAFRRAAIDPSPFDAADLEVDIAVDMSRCSADEVELVVTVRNAGTLDAPAGVEVAVHEGGSADGPLVQTLVVPSTLAPGISIALGTTAPRAESFFARVDPSAAGRSGTIAECDEADNEATVAPVPDCD